MRILSVYSRFLILTVFFFHGYLLGEGVILQPRHVVELEKGVPFFELMDRKEGLASVMDADSREALSITDWETMRALRTEFNPEVFDKLIRQFKNKERGWKVLMDELEGKKFNAKTIAPAIRRVLSSKKLLKNNGRLGLTAVQLAPVVMMASGGSTKIALGDDVWTFHYGYKHGDDRPGVESREENRKRTKSGRSFIDTNDRRTHDPSDRYYLTEVMKYLRNTENSDPFFKTIFEILTKGDYSGINKLTEEGKTVLGDWFGIYVAESRRHRMTGWKRMDWDNALTELTMLGPYTQEARQIRTKDGVIQRGKLLDYFGIGTDGAGLGGLAGIQRRKYTRAITGQMYRLAPTESKALQSAIGARRGADLCKGLMTYINSAKNQPAVASNATAITRASVDFIRAMATNAKEIAGKLAN